MRQSGLFQKTTKDISKSEVSRNAQLLTKGGYIHQLMAGVYSYLPLGLRVLSHIEQIIREEMNGIGGQEILMPALQPRDIWDTTGRWDQVDVLYKLKGTGEKDLALGPTHEEVVTPLAAGILSSYRDLPVAVYQIQTKFRNEARAKSGLLRGREFRMKDMYSFHGSMDDLDNFYVEVIEAYRRIFRRCGIGDITRMTYASGGSFSKYSHEFQTLTEYGEDTVYCIPGSDDAINKEILGDSAALAEIIPGFREGDEHSYARHRAIEVGNIFKLGKRFTEAFGLSYHTRDGKSEVPVMGCYGIGPSRVMGTIAECLSDERGLVWPEEVAPFKVHLVALFQRAEELDTVNDIYRQLNESGVSVLYDNRTDRSASEKLRDSDLLGIPIQVVVSRRTLQTGAAEWKRRRDANWETISLQELMQHLSQKDFQM